MTDDLRTRITQIIINALDQNEKVDEWERDWINRHMTDLILHEVAAGE